MATAAINEKKLRSIVKSALADAFKENRELMQDIVQEALEDIAITRAIEQGLATKSVPRKKVFAILEGGH
jgi:methionyl-tRNA synthetase